MTQQNLSGTILGQYELQELIGAGRMGAVYRAYQPALRREVAVRLLPDAGYGERFAYLAGIAASLEHPHIVRVYDYGVEQSTDYLVMQWMTGGSLSERLTQHPLPSLGEISVLVQQISSALNYAHERGIVHRDINPRNVLFQDSGIACAADFGIAQLAQETSPITAGYGTAGTWAYMSPEQWNGERLTPAVDQYALAVMIYFLMAGRPPFSGATPAAIMFKHLYELPPPLPDVSGEVMAVLDRALAKEAGNRFPTIDMFAEAFAHAVGDQTGEPTGFFSAPFARKPVPEVILSAPRPTPSYPRIPPFERSSRYKSPLLWVAAGAIVIALLLGLIRRETKQQNAEAGNTEMSLSGVGVSDDRLTEIPTENAAGDITGNNSGANPVMLPTETMIQATSTTGPTNTPLPSNTPTLPPTHTAALVPQVSEPTHTATVPPSQTTVPTNTAQPPSNTPTITPSPTITLSPTTPPTATTIPTATLLPPSYTPTAPPTNTKIPTAIPSATQRIAETETPCNWADVNDDHHVDIFDVRAISAHYGTTSNDATFEAHFDLDQDGVIGILDVQIAIAHYGDTCEP